MQKILCKKFPKQKHLQPAIANPQNTLYPTLGMQTAYKFAKNFLKLENSFPSCQPPPLGVSRPPMYHMAATNQHQ